MRKGTAESMAGKGQAGTGVRQTGWGQEARGLIQGLKHEAEILREVQAALSGRPPVWRDI